MTRLAGSHPANPKYHICVIYWLQLVFAELQRNLMKPVSDFLRRDRPCRTATFLAYVVLIDYR